MGNAVAIATNLRRYSSPSIGLGRDFISGCFRNSAGEVYRSRYTYFSNLVARMRVLTVDNNLPYTSTSLPILSLPGCWEQGCLTDIASFIPGP